MRSTLLVSTTGPQNLGEAYKVIRDDGCRRCRDSELRTFDEIDEGLQPWTEIPHFVDLIDDDDAGLDLVVQSHLRALRHAEFAF